MAKECKVYITVDNKSDVEMLKVDYTIKRCCDTVSQ